MIPIFTAFTAWRAPLETKMIREVLSRIINWHRTITGSQIRKRMDSVLSPQRSRLACCRTSMWIWRRCERSQTLAWSWIRRKVLKDTRLLWSTASNPAQRISLSAGFSLPSPMWECWISLWIPERESWLPVRWKNWKECKSKVKDSPRGVFLYFLNLLSKKEKLA